MPRCPRQPLGRCLHRLPPSARALRPTPLGLFRMVEARDLELTDSLGPGELEDLLKSHSTWTVDTHPGPAPPPTS